MHRVSLRVRYHLGLKSDSHACGVQRSKSLMCVVDFDNPQHAPKSTTLLALWRRRRAHILTSHLLLIHTHTHTQNSGMLSFHSPRPRLSIRGNLAACCCSSTVQAPQITHTHTHTHTHTPTHTHTHPPTHCVGFLPFSTSIPSPIMQFLQRSAKQQEIDTWWKSTLQQSATSIPRARELLPLWPSVIEAPSWSFCFVLQRAGCVSEAGSSWATGQWRQQRKRRSRDQGLFAIACSVTNRLEDGDIYALPVPKNTTGRIL